MINTEFEILDQLLISTSDCRITIFGNGHINNTYKVENKKGNTWLLQKINTTVFKNPQILIDNHVALLEEYDLKNEIAIPKLINEKSNNYIIGDSKQGYWRILNFFENTHSKENVTHKKQAVEAGKAFGSFVKGIANCDINKFKEPIPLFHNLTDRFNQFQQSIKENKTNRLNSVSSLTSFFQSFYKELQSLESKIQQQHIPIRIVHNDTKINNLLYKDETAVAVIDLDTVGPGNILYDYGDALRTLANETTEDQQDLSKVKFSIDWFNAFTEGYLKKVSSLLVQTEKEWFWQAPFLMTYIMGIRFLTDYLNGDIYYKTKYDEHNMIRAAVQKTLIEDMLKKNTEIKETIKSNLHNL